MIKRTLSTIVLWAVVIGTLYFFGARGGVVLLAVFSLLAQYEFQVILEKSGLPPWKVVPLVLGTLLILGAGQIFPENFTNCILEIFFLGGLVSVTVAALACVQNPAALNRLAGSVLSVVYVPVQLSCYAIMCQEGQSVAPAIWVIATAKFTDVGGYLVGSAIGRHKLAPSISPGKTWEGCAGGLVLAAIVAMLGVYFGRDYLGVGLTIGYAGLLSIPIGITAIVSDLAESAFKRRAGVKDSGQCIPGIGGALDLADSLLLTAPMALFLLNS